MDLTRIVGQIRDFRDQREWIQFHDPKNLAGSISIEASELLEIFQWTRSEDSLARARDRISQVRDEVADIAVYLIEFCDILGIDLESAIDAKLEKNATKYPVSLAKGNSKKYDEL